MYEDIYPKEKKDISKDDFEVEVEIDDKGNIKNFKKKKINLYPKGQTVGKRARTKASKKARETMKRAMKIRKYINEGEKDKE